MIKILLCDGNKKWQENFSVKLTDTMELVGAVETGRKAQEKINETDVDVIVINVGTKDFSFFEVVKYIKQTKPKVMIVMLSESKKQLEEYFYSESEIKKLGVSNSFIKPFPVYHLVKFIDQSFQHKQWAKTLNPNNQESSKAGIEEEIKEPDQSFTSLGVENFQNNNVTIFDLYIRLGKNKYLKVFHAGSKIDLNRIEKYRSKESDLRIHFKTGDRLAYVNFTNDLVRRQLNNGSKSTIDDVKMIDVSTKMLIEEIYLSGLPLPMVEESLAVCENIYATIDRNDDLKDLLSSFFSNGDTEEAHVSLTGFYTAIICKNVDWVTSHSRDNIILGALLHDIGKIKFPKTLKQKLKSKYSEKEKLEAQKHPEYGVDLLDGIDGISEQVKQIVYQHHELNSGDGYPNRLTSKKIYPLAKIVAFANCVSNVSMANKLSPIDSIKLMMEEKEDIMKYEPFVIKAFIKGFIESV